jgi:hypothetical protein
VTLSRRRPRPYDRGVSVAGSRDDPTPDLSELDTHFDSVVAGFMRGRVTPVLGAGVNVTGQPRAVDEWLGRYPPSGQELAAYLAEEFKYPGGPSIDLLHVSQYVYAIRGGSGPLYDALHEVFDAPFPTTPTHDFLAAVQAALRGLGRKPPLIVTTNYDDLVEAAFRARGESFDLLVYAAEGPYEGRFCTRTSEGGIQPIADPKTDVELDPDRRPVILKLHGFVDRESPNDDSYVITEDHYIEYLARMDLDNLIPVKVLERLRNCHFLFLGYSLADWNLRAILYKLWSDRRRDRDWWAIQLDPTELERRSWRRRGVDIFDIPLAQYLAGLSRRFHESLAGRS